MTTHRGFVTSGLELNEDRLNSLLVQSGEFVDRPTASSDLENVVFAAEDTGEWWQVQSGAWVRIVPADPAVGTAGLRTLDGTTQGGSPGVHTHTHAHFPDTSVDWSSSLTGSWSRITTWQDLVGATATIGPGLAYFYVIGYYSTTEAEFNWRLKFTNGTISYLPNLTGQTTSLRSDPDAYAHTDTTRLKIVLSTTKIMQVQIRVPDATNLHSITFGSQLHFDLYYVEVPPLPITP